MKTTINWRPYPEQKPDIGEAWMKAFSVIRKGEPSGDWYQKESGFPVGVTHFALPEDIITEEA